MHTMEYHENVHNDVHIWCYLEIARRQKEGERPNSRKEVKVEASLPNSHLPWLEKNYLKALITPVYVSWRKARIY